VHKWLESYKKMPLTYWMEYMGDTGWNWNFEFSNKWPVFSGCWYRGTLWLFGL